MASRLELQSELERLLGTKEVYYQPPESMKMEYPAIRYSLKDISSRYADDIKYSNRNSYELIVISKLPDPKIVDSILELSYCSFDRHYKSDNLNHYAFTLYY